jgi:hypothetical protein
MANSGQSEDGRRGKRRLGPQSIRPSGTFPGLNPALVVPPPGDALPGELAALERRARRTKPVTEQEALGVWRRKKRADIANGLAGGDRKVLDRLVRKGLPAEAEEGVPDELPGWDSKKIVLTMRIHPRLRALADALAELEGTNLTSLVELALWKLVNSPPRDPATVEREFDEMLDNTVIADRVQAEYEKAVSSVRRQPRQ